MSFIPLNSGQLATATASTPGTDFRFSTISSHRAAGCGCCVTVSRSKSRSGEKPSGRSERCFKVAVNSDARKSTTKQNATCAAINPCMRRRRACGSSPPFNALTGFTHDARSAGISPNSSITTRVRSNPNPSARQSAGKTRRIGLPGVPMLFTTNGAAHHANIAPRPDASNASIALSTMSIWTSRNRPAPIDTRSAIPSLAKAACAVIRLATWRTQSAAPGRPAHPAP